MRPSDALSHREEMKSRRGHRKPAGRDKFPATLEFMMGIAMTAGMSPLAGTRRVIVVMMQHYIKVALAPRATIDR